MNIRRQIRSAARNIMKLASSMLETVESAPLSLGNFSITFTMIIIVRILVDFGTQSFRSEPLSYILYEFSHTYLFFLFSFLMFLPIIRLAGASSWRRGANLLLVGFLIIWTPPVIDKLIFGNGLYWSFYELDGIKGLIVNFFRFFNDNPSIGITYGVRAEVAIMSIGLGLYAFKKSKEISRACGIAVLSYLAFYILGTFPSYIAIPALAAHKGLFAVTNIDIAGLMLSPKKFFRERFRRPEDDTRIQDESGIFPSHHFFSRSLPFQIFKKNILRTFTKCPVATSYLARRASLPRWRNRRLICGGGAGFQLI